MDQNKVPKRVIVAEFILGHDYKQRSNSEELVDDILLKTKLLVNSTKRFKVPVYVLTNEKIAYKTTELVVYHQEIPKTFSDLPLYYRRWVLAYQFLLAHPEVEEAAFVDLGDVEMLHNPFGKFEQSRLYIGDEESLVTNFIVSKEPKPSYAVKFFDNHNFLQLLNPGVVAGLRPILLEFLGLVNNTIARTMIDIELGKESGLRKFEMAIINYVAYRYFPNRIVHGRRVSTVFFQDKGNDYSWFKHK